MKLFLLSLLCTAAVSFNDGGGKASRSTQHKSPFHLANPLARLARCSGDAYCTACSNCNYCGHCAGGGGTCGVCAPLSPRVSRSPSRSSTRSVRSYRGGGATIAAPVQLKAEIAVTGDYYVAATTLNLRLAPSADAAVVAVLHRNDVVTVQELTSKNWAKVTAMVDNEVVEGYLSRAYLSEAETH